MKVLHKGGFSEDERKSYLSTIHHNILSSMQTLIAACSTLDIPLSDDIRPVANAFEEMNPHDNLNVAHSADIKKLWQDTGIKEAYKRRSEFQLNDSAPYFFKCLGNVFFLSICSTRRH